MGGWKDSQPDHGFQLGEDWAVFEACGEKRPPTLVRDGTDASILQGGISSLRFLKPGTLPLGNLVGKSSGQDSGHPLTNVHGAVLGAPERPDREDMPKYDRIAFIAITPDGEVSVTQEDGVVARMQLGSVAWLKTEFCNLQFDQRVQDICPQDRLLVVGCRKAGSLVFCEGLFPGVEYSQGDDTALGLLPVECRPKGGRRSFLTFCVTAGLLHIMRISVDTSGRLSARRSHTQGRAKDGHIFKYEKRQPGSLEMHLGAVRFPTQVGSLLELLGDARIPPQNAAKKQLSYLGIKAGDGNETHVQMHDLDGFQAPSCTRHGKTVLLDGAVILTANARFVAFAQLPRDCWPSQHVTMLVARTGPAGQLLPERLDVNPEGKLTCPQLPEELGLEHSIHFNGAVFGVDGTEAEGGQNDSIDAPGNSIDKKEEGPDAENDEWNSWQNYGTDDSYKDWNNNWNGEWKTWKDGDKSWWVTVAPEVPKEERDAWRRCQDLCSRDRRFQNKFTSGAEFMEFERKLQWFRAHDCTESHRLTHSCFKGRSDFTETGMLVFDTEEDLEGLNHAIEWLYLRNVPVVLMERQTRIFPMIFDIDLKATRPEFIKRVPMKLRKTKPWQSTVDFCRWPGADHLVLEDVILLRHLARVIFEFFPDLPLIDFCVFNASGWDRVKDSVKVSLHLVAPYVLVTPRRLCDIREKMLEYLGEVSEYPGHPIKNLLDKFLAESDDNTWDKVVDQTVTSGTNGLRMPYCDKAQRTLKREFIERKAAGEIFTERELMSQRAYLREEAGRPCLPEGIVRLFPIPKDAEEFALPEAKWMCKGGDLPISEWIRLGRCRHSFRLPLAPPGPTPWRPPLKYQWAEPSALWEDRSELKGSPMVRIYSGDASEFRQRFDQKLDVSKCGLVGKWLSSANGARWRGGLKEDSMHEVRYIKRAERVVLLLAPEPGASRAFAELRSVLADWTSPDDVPCVPLCGSPVETTEASAALHMIVTPSEDFPDPQQALDFVPEDESLHRVVLRGGVHELQKPLVLRRPVMLEGEGRWETTLRSYRQPALRFEGAGARQAMVRNIHVEVMDKSPEQIGGTAIEIIGKSGEEAIPGFEPAIVGCTVTAVGRWGTCIRVYGGAPQIVRSRFTNSRYGIVSVDGKGRIEDNEFVGLGEMAITLIGGAPWVHRNTIGDCGGPGVLCGADCHAVFEQNEIQHCLAGVRVTGKRTEIEMRGANRFLHSGLCDEHQLEAPPGVIPCGATAMVKSCRPFAFLPKSKEALVQRLLDCQDANELTICIRSSRRKGEYVPAFKAHRKLCELRKRNKKGPLPSSPPATAEVAVCVESWDGKAEGYEGDVVAVTPGVLCEIRERADDGWVRIKTSDNSSGWCNPHVLS